MPFSVRLDATLEAQIEAEARLRGVSKSEVVKDALERVYGRKNPGRLLAQVRAETAAAAPKARRKPAAGARSEKTGQALKELLRAKRPA